jgi:hypothetical protein
MLVHLSEYELGDKYKGCLMVQSNIKQLESKSESFKFLVHFSPS